MVEMVRREVQLSSWSVDLERDPIRNPPRPLSLRHESYEDDYDFTTVFYDCFWDDAGEAIILIGPPLLNLQTDLALTVVAWPSMQPCPFRHCNVFLGCRVVVQPPAGTTGLLIRTGKSESFITPQPNLCELFRNRRVIMTLSRNNDLVWIQDWILFNRTQHSCDAVLIYDNDSDAYSINAIYASLEQAVEGMQVVVLAWPFKYGVADWRLPLSYGIVDSLYCQTGMLEHARRRFLAHARSVLHTDIDELAVTDGGSSVFELVENSSTGLLVFDGVWVENFPVKPRDPLGDPPRHTDFVHVRASDQVGCEAKWAVIPSRVPKSAQWHVHRILGMAPSESSGSVELRHFRAINTDWTVDRKRSRDARTSGGASDPRRLRVDVRLQEALARAFPEQAGPPPVEDGPPPARSAYAWRVHGGRLASEQKWREAIAAVQAALFLMPDHPGFRLFLARLNEQEKNAAAARALRAEAEALRLRDPWYHLQRGRWLQDEGDLVAAQKCFSRAIELDPRFTSAYHELARNQQHRRCHGAPGRPEEILATCARRVLDDAPTRALLAKELDGRGRTHDALAHIEAAIALDADNPHYHCLHARILRRIGRLDEAERAARRGMRLDDLAARMHALGEPVADGWLGYQWRSPTTPGLPAELAEIMAAKGEWAAAEAAARDALWAARSEPDQYYRLSQILAMRGRHEEATQELEAAISLARREMRRPTPREGSMVSRNCSLEARANRLSRFLRAAGRRDEAILVLRETLALVPNSSPLQDNLASLLVDAGERDAAAALLRAAIRARPRDAKLRHSLSKVLKGTAPRAAMDAARVAVELEPDRLPFQEHLIALLVAAEENDEATRVLAAALALNSHRGPLHFHLSRLFQRGRRSGEALAAARRAVELDPRKAYLHEHLVALLIEAGKDGEAECALRAALKHHGGSADLHFHLSRLLQRRREPEEALLAARRAVELEPLRARWRDHLAALLMAAGRFDEAEAGLRAALKRKVENGALYWRLSRLLQQGRRPEEALPAARRAVELDPRKAYLHEHLVALLIEAGKDGEAECALRAALKLHGGSADLHFHLSRLLQRRREPEEALLAARRAVELEPLRARWRDHLAALLMAAGRFDEAEAGLRAALERKVENGALYWHLSRLLQRRRQPEEALLAAQRAVELDPRKDYLREHLAALQIEVGQKDEAERAA